MNTMNHGLKSLGKSRIAIIFLTNKASFGLFRQFEVNSHFCIFRQIAWVYWNQRP